MLVKGENSLCQLRLEVILRVLFLLVQRVPRVLILLDGPTIQPVNLVQRDAERRVLLLEKLDRFESLLLKAVHDIDNQDSQVTQ